MMQGWLPIQNRAGAHSVRDLSVSRLRIRSKACNEEALVLEKIKTTGFFVSFCLGLTMLLLSPTQAEKVDAGGATSDAEFVAQDFFDSMDANEDGIVTQAEFEASPAARMMKSFESLRPELDGAVSRGHYVRTFIRVHKNFDNEV